MQTAGEGEGLADFGVKTISTFIVQISLDVYSYTYVANVEFSRSQNHTLKLQLLYNEFLADSGNGHTDHKSELLHIAMVVRIICYAGNTFGSACFIQVFKYIHSTQ